MVDDVESSGRGTWLRLSCVDDDAQGEVLEVIWEVELDGQVMDSEAWAQIGAKGFDDARLFAAYFNTLRWNCVTATDPKLFQAPFRAGGGKRIRSVHLTFDSRAPSRRNVFQDCPS
jgi:hypothetical protein